LVPESTSLNISRPQGFHCLWALEDSSLLVLLSHGYPQLATQCQKPATTHPSEHQAWHLAILLVPGGFPPQQSMETQHSPLSLTAREPWLLCQRARMPESMLREGKL
jgi:hypothetical protein